MTRFLNRRAIGPFGAMLNQQSRLGTAWKLAKQKELAGVPCGWGHELVDRPTRTVARTSKSDKGRGPGLAKRWREGGAGVWGPDPMRPNPPRSMRPSSLQLVKWAPFA